MVNNNFQAYSYKSTKGQIGPATKLLSVAEGMAVRPVNRTARKFNQSQLQPLATIPKGFMEQSAHKPMKWDPSCAIYCTWLGRIASFSKTQPPPLSYLLNNSSATSFSSLCCKHFHSHQSGENPFPYAHTGLETIMGWLCSHSQLETEVLQMHSTGKEIKPPPLLAFN